MIGNLLSQDEQSMEDEILTKKFISDTSVQPVKQLPVPEDVACKTRASLPKKQTSQAQVDENHDKLGVSENEPRDLPFAVVASESENKECEKDSIMSSAIAIQGSSDCSS